jgi:hypothetical protein
MVILREHKTILTVLKVKDYNSLLYSLSFSFIRIIGVVGKVTLPCYKIPMKS